MLDVVFNLSNDRQETTVILPLTHLLLMEGTMILWNHAKRKEEGFFFFVVLILKETKKAVTSMPPTHCLGALEMLNSRNLQFSS